MVKYIKKNNLDKESGSGFIFLEIIIAIAVITIAFVALLGVVFSVLNVSGSVQKVTQADSLIKEEFEAIRAFRDGTQWSVNGLGTVSTGGTNFYHLIDSSNTWALVSGIETSGVFTRKVLFDKVSRDPTTFNIESTYNSSHDDADTRKITVTVSWANKSLQDVSYLTNWK